MFRRLRFSRILCPVDFSPLSRRAVAQAAAIAREQQAELRLLYVADRGASSTGATVDSLTHEKLMERLREFLREAGPGVRLGAAIREGQPPREILRMASRWSADLIVMGAGGVVAPRTGRSPRRLLGNVARIVTDRALCPVLLVPAAAEPAGPFREIVCATDTDPTSLVAVAHALSLAQEWQGHVTLIHVEPEPSGDDQYDALASLVPESALAWCDARIMVTSGEPAATIVELAASVAADLIVIGAPRAVVSVTHAVVANAVCPVLIAHERPGMDRIQPQVPPVTATA